MPIYEYRCEKCEEEFEVSQRITEDPLTEHESCGGLVKRLISRTSFTLKGSGWYSDHYGLQPGAGKNGASSDAVGPVVPPDVAAGPKGDGKAEGKDAKTEKSADAKPASGEKSSSTKEPAKAAPAAKPASTEKKSSSGAGSKDA